MKIGDKVKMSEELKAGLIHNDSQDHVKEFGECIGTIEEINKYNDAEVRWQPLNLKYAYPLKFLIPYQEDTAKDILKEELINFLIWAEANTHDQYGQSVVLLTEDELIKQAYPWNIPENIVDRYLEETK